MTADIEAAYRLQMETARHRIASGDRLAGYKIGCISAAVQSQLGVREPVFGCLYESEIHPSGTALDASRFNDLAIEGEFAVRFGIGVLGVIELHNYRSVTSACELIACNAMHAGVVLPRDGPHVRDLDLILDEPLSVWKNGELLGTATARSLPGGPAASIARLEDHLARLGSHLEPGQLILTGSPLPLYRVAEGDRIEVTCAKLGPPVTATIRRAAL